ncbi:MAG: cytochrome b/b6 domain-containing protein [Mariprofundaceae bacterium]|nr:cytochrome b/b6 domain-containing protein [Mariprofundaceae bacterium]
MNNSRHIQVWDPLVRIFHWSVAGCFIIAYLLEDEMLRLHLLMGSIVLGLVIFRLIWGVMGTEYSRFTDFACSIRDINRHLHDLVRLRPAHHTGHTPVGGIMIFVLLAGLLMLCLSGVMLYALENSSAPFALLMSEATPGMILVIENSHGLIADTLALLIVFHIAGAVLESVLQKENLIRAMVTGYKTERKENL